MTVTYEQARELIRQRFEPGWPGGNFGTFCLDDRMIIENDEYYVIPIGAREFLIDSDWSYSIPGVTHIVYKSDGRIGSLTWADMTAAEPSIRQRPNPSPTLTT